MYRILLNSILFATSFALSAETLAQNWGMSLHGSRGFLLPHRQNMLHMPDGPAHSVDLRLFKNLDGSKAWHQLYRFPEVGIAVKGMDLANQRLLGYGIGAAVYLSSPIAQTNRFRWNLEVGAGPGWITKTFDLADNYQNIAISSHFNSFIMLGQKFSYRFSESLGAELAMSFNHYSNAAYSLPNLGINYPMASLGLVWNPSRMLNETDTFSHEKVNGRWMFAFASGIKEAPQPYKVKNPTFTLSVDRYLGLSKKSSLSLGSDVFYNVALYANRNYDSTTVSALGNTQVGIRVGYNMHVDDLMLFVQMGVYAIDTYKRDGLLYHRVGFRHFVADRVAVNLSLKTHFFKADYFEFGIAYRI